MKIFDCITFFEEHLVSGMRFNILNNYVDKFIVCEGKENHRGIKKKINFDPNEFPEFKNKIKHIICEEFPKNINPWQRQAIQREKILENLDEADDNDLILFSDPDEIPNPKKLINLNIKKKYIIFLQKNFYYKLNIQDIDLGCNWEGTRGCLKKNLKSIDFMRQKVLKKNLKYSFWRFDKEKNLQLINDGGWHFSYLMSPEQIKNKIKTFAHTEFDRDEFTDINNINKQIKSLKDIFNRKVNYSKVEFDENYPEYILKNLDKFKEWLV